jgi:hyperosmotically inducible periplasmic protein
MQLTTKLIASAIVLTLSFVANPSVYAFGDADSINQTPLAESFKTLDKDNDGTLSFTEAKDDKLFNKKNFAKADTDHDGTLTQNEFGEYKSAYSQKVIKRAALDTEITAKIKASILQEEGFKGFSVSVETQNGIVQLSGFVASQALVERAGTIALATTGVKSVKNNLIVKS